MGSGYFTCETTMAIADGAFEALLASMRPLHRPRFNVDLGDHGFVDVVAGEELDLVADGGDVKMSFDLDERSRIWRRAGPGRERVRWSQFAGDMSPCFEVY